MFGGIVEGARRFGWVDGMDVELKGRASVPRGRWIDAGCRLEGMVGTLSCSEAVVVKDGISEVSGSRLLVVVAGGMTCYRVTRSTDLTGTNVAPDHSPRAREQTANSSTGLARDIAYRRNYEGLRSEMTEPHYFALLRSSALPHTSSQASWY